MNVPMILAVAPTGARRTKADHQTIPISPAEIASEATNCLNNGAALLHLHVRSNKQSHSIDPGAYSEAIKEVRNGVGDQLIIQILSLIHI